MEILNLNKCKKDNFSIKEFNNKYTLKYNNKGFLIEPEIAFKNCNIYSNIVPNKIKIILDNDEEHENFESSIRLLYDVISEIIEQEDDINVNSVINPIYNKDNNKMLFFVINSNTVIKNLENEEIIKVDELYKKNFNMYPIIYGPNFNIYNDKIYINFVLHTILIKESKKEWNNQITIDYKKVNKAMNKIL